MHWRERVAHIVEKVVESHLRWVGYVCRRPVEVPVRREDRMEVRSTARGRGNLRKTVGETYRIDLDRWYCLIFVVDPT